MRARVEMTPVGALPRGDATEFRVWAPGHRTVDVVLYGPDAERVVRMEEAGEGWFTAAVEGAGPGSRYKYRLDGGDIFPDPAARSLPEGVHGPAEVVDPSAFRWSDEGWRGRPLEELSIYELHVGTATPEGTFDSLIGRLDDLVDLGVTAVEVMPVAEFPGRRNWGYDGVAIYAPSSAYGGPEAFRRFVDAAHARGLAVLLDVVYNHFGPEGNYLPAFTSGKIFTEAHHTPWGAAVNYDGEGSAAVREFVVGNALHWLREYHVDGLRLDATHAIIDDSERHLLRELSETLHAALPDGRHFVLVAEDERNERQVVTPASEGGLGLDAVWADDLHHQMRRLTAGDKEGYFADFEGTVESVAETLRRGWFYEGQESPGHGKARGTPAGEIAPMRFVHCLQNHDQVGNRAFGDRLSDVVPAPVYRAASALLLLSPYTPLLWMGQEWAASTPFQYFTDHPEELGRLVTEGRRREFGRFSAFRDPALRERIPDPQAEETFTRSRLRWEERDEPGHAGTLALYRELLRMRHHEPALLRRDRGSFAVTALTGNGIALRREGDGGEALLLVVSFGDELVVDLAAREETQAPGDGEWMLVLSTEEGRFGGQEKGAMATLSPKGELRLAGVGAAVLRTALNRLGAG